MEVVASLHWETEGLITHSVLPAGFPGVSLSCPYQSFCSWLSHLENSPTSINYLLYDTLMLYVENKTLAKSVLQFPSGLPSL